VDLNIDNASRDEIKDILNQILQILEGLRFAHELSYEDNLGFTIRGILHGNIKTRKVIFDTQNVPKLIDFMFMDVARQKDVVMPLPPDVQAYFAQEQLRIADYSAPELIENGRISEQTDIYSVGAVLFELFTKQSLSDIPVQSEMDVYKWIKKRNLSIPFYVGQIIYKALRPNPADRYKHVSEIIAEIIKRQSWWNRFLYFFGVKKIQ
jgi:serine/threonine protein kinase